MKKHKLSRFITILLLLFLLFLYFYLKSYNYRLDYKINKYNIHEEYSISDSIYKFNIKYKKNNYPFLINSKYKNARKIIKDIKILNDNCILPISDVLSFYPLCYKDNNYYSYNLANKSDYKYIEYKKINKSYNNININYLHGKNYLVYNYKSFYLIGKNNKEIKLFNKDIYSLSLYYQFDNYLLIPNYNENYYFSKIFVINMDNGELKEIKLNNKISFESVFVGNIKNRVYLLDKKEEKEYELNINKLKIRETEIVVIENNKLVRKSLKELYNNDFTKKEDNPFNYKLIDNKLYSVIDDVNINISNLDNIKIIDIDKDTVYYLSNERLYMYNPLYGEVYLIENFEWNFNNTNVIFISK